MIVYVNGQWLEDTEATVSFQDRAFVFADAVYEVLHIYNGALFKLDLHQERLQKGLDTLRIPYRANDLKPVFDELLKRNPGVQRGSLYVQVSRGAAPRAHGLPKLKEPTIVAYVKPFQPDLRIWEQGGRAVLVEDLRWQMCHVKTTGLLLNCMAKEEALERGCDDAIFHRGEIVTEASASNLFIVKNGTLLTHPNGPWILPGITRHVVIELARKEGIPVEEVQFTKADLLAADELFLTGTLSEVAPYVEVDGQKIGNGQVGPVTRRIQEAFRSETGV
ncbi:D-amino-acid transaminase [Effusibacillus lacus]|uniref:D-alanine aminotransferase n=1 Tax=Effusibacillus lacus TaxID=1348429 RepID=A0A292YRQ1_9BACL|nr:D-amino-acid transaminase [Effusibacillus lacus]TCS74929.1 D-alanine transaminase [Effusibacillus lacus]GAX91599.1 D-amino-acid transaminase [Effusibacillus lacus]